MYPTTRVNMPSLVTWQSYHDLDSMPRSWLFFPGILHKQICEQTRQSGLVSVNPEGSHNTLHC